MSATGQENTQVPTRAQPRSRQQRTVKRLPPSRIPLPVRSRPPLSAVQPSAGGHGENSTSPPQEGPSRVKVVPNFPKLHQKWEEKMKKRKQENRKKHGELSNHIEERHPSIDHMIPSAHHTLPRTGRQRKLPVNFQLPPKSPFFGSRKKVASSGFVSHGRPGREGNQRVKELLERMVQTTITSIRTRPRVEEDEEGGGDMADIKLNLEERITADELCSHTGTVPPVISLPSRSTVYQVDEELCALLSASCAQAAHTRQRCHNPVAQLLEHHYFVPVDQQTSWRYLH